MKFKVLLTAMLWAGVHSLATAASIVKDNLAVDEFYSNNGVTLPLVNLGVEGRYATQLTFDKLTPKENGGFVGTVNISPLQSLNDSNVIVMDKDFDPVIAEKLKKLLQQHVSDYHKPGAVIRVDMNGKLWRGVIGLKRLNSDEPLNYSDRHRIGSLTKTFVNNTVMQLVQKGLIKLDAPINTYLPDVQIPNKDKITVRHLIAHRSGLYNYVLDNEHIQKSMQTNPLKVFKPEDLIALSNAQPVKSFAPGTDYSYTNTGLILAGLIIEKVTGKPIIDVVHEYTVKRLGLLRTEFPKDPGIQSNYFHGHADYNGDGVLSSQEIVTYLDPSVSWAAGAMISNLDDLAKWMKAYVDGDLLEKSLQQQVLSDCLPSAPDYGASYCLGVVKITWPFNTTDPTKWWYGHLGQINGYDNVVFRNTSRNITVAMTNNNYFINTPPEEGTGILIFDLLNIVDPQPAAKIKFDTTQFNAQALGGE